MSASALGSQGDGGARHDVPSLSMALGMTSLRTAPLRDEPVPFAGAGEAAARYRHGAGASGIEPADHGRILVKQPALIRDEKLGRADSVHRRVALPILAFVALCMFKQRIHEILGRLRRGKFLGQEIELEQDLRQLHETAQAAASETAQVVQLPSTADAPDKQKREAGDLVERVFEEASRNPKVALILLASELEREVRQLFASLGSLGRARPGSLPQSIRTLEENGAPPRCGAGA